MKNYKELLSELPSKTAVFGFGQFNPPNTGHELLIKVIRKLASQRKADHFVFVSSTNDAKKNPLDISKKMQYLGTMFPNTRFIPREIDNIYSTLKKYKHLIMVVPADSVEYYKKIVKKNKLNSVEFITAGSKCPDEDDKLIKSATKGNYTLFKSGLPTTVRELDGKRLMNDVRSGIGLEPIKEQINLVKDKLREQYFRGEIFKIDDIVESDSIVYKIIKRGSNHLLLQCEDGSKVSKWIQDVQLTEKEFMLKQLLEFDMNHSTTSKTVAATGQNNQMKKAQADTAKMKLALDQAKEKEDLAAKQEREKQALKTEAVDSPVVDKNSKFNMAKSIMSLSDYRKTIGMGKEDNKDEKSIENKIDDALSGKSEPLASPSLTLRHQKIKQHLGEETEEEISISEFGDWSEEDFEKLVEQELDSWTDDDMLELYEDDELAIIDDETGEEIEPVSEEAELDNPVLMEILSRYERIKAKARMRRTKTKRARAEKVALKRLSTPQVANKRAHRMAISAMKKRLLRGQNPQHVSIGQKERIERFIHQRRKIVNRLAARMVTRVRQVEKARMSHKKFTKPNNGVSF